MASSIHFEDVTSLDQRGGIIRNFDRPPKKDTVTVPDGGYTVVRFHANNPENTNHAFGVLSMVVNVKLFGLVARWSTDGGSFQI
ncbi:L-ascorbate oxidase [Plakobranchus ocellatus]|uniref:L-ascorbate oxidase n=1 Tax=Plakobranchus ocellatus TaxID=259542 RepID=A0AAV3ZS57_9GAST|nr:L-ascorbate oxidase [Plakobranchus ocellatus]